MFSYLHLLQLTSLALLTYAGHSAFVLRRRNEDLKDKLAYSAHRIDQLERAYAAQPEETREGLRLAKEQLSTAKHELGKMTLELAFARVDASGKEQALVAANEELEQTIRDLKEKISLLEAISTLNGSGMVPKTLDIHGYKGRIDGAVSTWMAAYEKLEATREELKNSKAATSNVRKALALGLRPGSPTIFEGVKKRENLGVKATLFDVSVKCEMYMGQLGEEKEARKALELEVRAARAAAKRALKEAKEAKEACRVAVEAKADMAMELELANTETEVLRSWVEMLEAPKEQSALTVGEQVEEKKEMDKLRVSSSLPNMMISLVRMQQVALEKKEVMAPLASLKKLEVRRKVAAVPSVPTSLSISFSLSDAADNSGDEKENFSAL
ncbi:hypothetical protein BDY19DRAFT_468866 [Irpex rosettiformis]|uniref:Uncharacterized protein n=1 Tax=Irpex rosettiformis TaxID=378272 RepID=A0ACB8TSG9_9APHY|nr:hypothetical protein BDY19DRAFT_468866 [Irpex rosettiformis]